jgi:hypothetical protein|mmetsp:Transcript_20385/g.36979  ORF Transcript_20385/g.36979 Transcript_20385/m.36979 type:complete len:207 (+) Transcript_20385:135-755(+)|eukprot:CAMPEP_0202496198 /NCGR_PEP_ID=MMETSP1361-20130828/19208_1 /ASSEMBLY_ACC=CAM_ASM_000849 /TAXON_ID=210615 /ORGANISM="Staurosira complex sp., Strain CCMP2646" /LENGTH=206 /DNA_ID=CAMNT_0049127463 /DNA_START=97 /DNA_END=717 /DNA_ORIENTATION=-
MAPFRALSLRTVATHVGIGMASASYWRGAWYLLDDNLFPESPLKSALASLSLGTVGMAASQGLVEKAESLSKQGSVRRLCVVRFGAIYSVAISCVLVWRGTWLLWDCVYESVTDTHATTPGHLSRSGVLSHGIASVGLLGCGLFASVLAPPAAASVIRDIAVKTGHKPYSGPAQQVIKSFFGAKTSTSVQRTIHTTRRKHFTSTKY